jgi:endonuclease YncB( thermonuclease family)
MAGRVFPSGFFVRRHSESGPVRLPVAVLLTCIVLSAGIVTANAGDDVPWTERPVKVDRSKQTYQRLPSSQQPTDTRIWLSVPDRIRLIDSASFSIGSKVYRIGGIHPVAVTRFCKDPEAGRWSCGRLAGVLLGNLVRSTRLLCEVAPSASETVLRRCRSGTKDVAREIVAAGFGRADGDSTLTGVEALARSNKAGLWRNPACLSDFDHC